MLNRLGAVNPGGMIYALKQDVVLIDPAKGFVAGNVQLRSDKRPRPIALRLNSGVETRLDFSKELLTAVATNLAETGTAREIAAMVYHEQRLHASFKPDGTSANFVLNGLPRRPGAPFADPCVDDSGLATGKARTYKAAAFQLDMKLNKAGWHFHSRAFSRCGSTLLQQSRELDRRNRSSSARIPTIASPSITRTSSPASTSRTTFRFAHRRTSLDNTSTW